MSINVNGTDIGSSIKLNNTDLSEIIFNGVSVWKARQLLKKLPYDFYSGCAVVYNNEIHILGSYYSTGNQTKHYKWNGSEWVSVSTLPYQFMQGCAVVYNNEIHILGGSYGTYRGHYKWDGTTWTQCTSIPYDFYGGCAVVYNNEIHLLGSAVYPNEKKHYKWNGSSWSSVSTLTYNFVQGSAVVFNNAIHILGGLGTETQHLKWNGSSWSSGGAIVPYNFLNGGSIVYNNNMYVLGSSYSTDDQKKFYKFNGSTWTQLSNLPFRYAGGDGKVVLWNSGATDEIVMLGASETGKTRDVAQYDGTSWTVAQD